MSTAKWKIKRYKDGGFTPVDDLVVDEVPLTLFFNETELVTILSLGDHPDELAVGFMRSEGFLSDPADLEEVVIEEGAARVRVKHLRNLA